MFLLDAVEGFWKSFKKLNQWIYLICEWTEDRRDFDNFNHASKKSAIRWIFSQQVSNEI